MILDKIFNNTKLIKIKTINSDKNGFEVISQIHADINSKQFRLITLDFKSCTFFDANMSAPLYAVIVDYALKNKLKIINMEDKIKEIFDKNGFSNKLGIKSEKNSEVNTNVIPFQKFDLSAKDEEFYEYLENYMQKSYMPKMSDKLLKKFHQSLFELFRNSSEHSSSSRGIFVCGEYSTKKKRIDFTISDAGHGIKYNVNNYTGEKMTSSEAIKWAMIEGNSTRGGDNPGGLGLKLLQDFITKNNGKLQIISQAGYYEYSAQSGTRCVEMKKEFPGTTINIEINTNDKKSYYLSSEINKQDIF